MTLTRALLTELKQWDTPTICNALELVAPERRGHGFTIRPFTVLRPLAFVRSIARLMSRLTSLESASMASALVEHPFALIISRTFDCTTRISATSLPPEWFVLRAKAL